MLTGGRARLILLVGSPNTGKGRLLREFRVRAASYPCRLVPEDAADGGGAPWLVVNKQSTVDDFRRLATIPGSAEANQQGQRRNNFDVILIYGYRPDEDFHQWFSGEFIPQLDQASPPRKVIVSHLSLRCTPTPSSATRPSSPPCATYCR
jgi:hypothetical protein